MTEQDELVVLQRAKEEFPNETPRIICDNGSQFLAKDFKEFIRICGMTHVRTSPYYPQSNGKAKESREVRAIADYYAREAVRVVSLLSSGDCGKWQLMGR